MNERYTVYILAVLLATAKTAEGGGSLLEIYAQPYGFGEDLTDLTPAQTQDVQQAQTLEDTPAQTQDLQPAPALDDNAVRKGWDRVAAPLRPVGLFKSGCTAAGAARKLGLKKPVLAVYQKFWKRYAYIDNLRLRLAGATVPAEWQAVAGGIEGRSAELGLALALLLAASQAPRRLVIATGRLGGQPVSTRSEDPDVEILSVGRLPEKLRLIEQLAKTRNLPRGPNHTDPVWLFTPTFDNGEEVKTLPEAGRLKDWGITVMPVKTLGEAAGHLKAERVRWMWQDLAMLGGIACLPLILAAAIYGWLQPPLIITPPKLEIFVRDGQNRDRSSIEQVPLVYPGQILDLAFSHHEREFIYLLKLHEHGKVDIEDVKDIAAKFAQPRDQFETKVSFAIQNSAPASSSNASTSPDYWTFLMLVSGQRWGKTQRQDLARSISAAIAKPNLPSGVQYRFNAWSCKPFKVDSNITGSVSYTGYDFSAEPVPPPDANHCDNWALKLLETLKQQTQGKIRLSGYAFQVAPTINR